MNLKTVAILFAASLIQFSCDSKQENVQYSFVLQSGNPGVNEILLQCRFAASDSLVHNDMPGIACTARFEYSTDSLFHRYRHTDYVTCDSSSDFILKQQVNDLKASTRYYYRAHARLGNGESEYSLPGTFTTFPVKHVGADISFAIATGFNYEHYFGLDTARNRIFKDEPRLLGASGVDRVRGFEAFETIRSEELDFFIANGDVVYYDKPSSMPGIWARNKDDMRAKWHRYFTMPRNREMCLDLPVYYLKDDHDHRYNDCDTTKSEEKPPSHELGMEVFREQLPVCNPKDDESKTYRTQRMGKDLQLWFVEGRDYRSPNISEDNSTKTIWGAEQKAWLKRTLLESDATYKLLISPTPMIGPDDAYKKDNHANIGGFQTERDEFFDFLREHDFIGKGFFIICGDRHWQYHTIHPSGLQEFSCGAFIDQNSRAGRLPGDPASTDPDAEIEVPFVQIDNWGGGFLHVHLEQEKNGSRLNFLFKDKLGKIRYSYSAGDISGF